MEANEKRDFRITMIVDGGCKNNGAPNAVAYGSSAILRDGKVIARGKGEWPFLHTNNQAEIAIVASALEDLVRKIRAAGKTTPNQVRVTIKTDSQLVVGYFQGGFNRKDEALAHLAWHVDQIIALFRSVEFVHVAREEAVKVLGH